MMIFADSGVPFNVRKYGAMGDGITDDTVALQQFINDCTTNNRIGEIPNGTYYSSNLTGASNLRLIGSGTIKHKSGTNGNLLSFTDCSNVSILGISFDGNKANQTTTSTALKFVNCSNVKLGNVLVDNVYGCADSNVDSALTFYNCSYATVDDVTVKNTKYNGVLFSGGSTYCVVRGGNFSYNGYSGISTVSASYIKLLGVKACYNNTSNISINGYYNEAIGCDANYSVTNHGINLGHPSADALCEGSKVIGGNFHNNKLFGVAVYGDATYNQNKVLVSGVNARGNEVGVWVSYANNCQLNNVFAESNTTDGVQVRGNGNIISGAYSKTNTRYGLWLRGGDANKIYFCDAGTPVIDGTCTNTTTI